MLVLDLRWLLLTALFFLVVLPLTTIWLYQWQDRKQRRILPSNQTLIQIFDQAPFGYLALQDSGHYRFANQYACRLLRLENQAGRLPADDWAQILLEDRDEARVAHDAAGRYRQIALPVNRFVQWWVFPAQTIDIIFILDITSHRQVIEQAQLLLGGLSHELRTPIATILTHLEVLSVPNLTKEAEEQSVQLLKQEASRMSKMVNQMLMLGRLELEDVFEHHSLDLVSLVEETIAQIASIAKRKNLAVLFEADAPLPVLFGDESRLKQVFLNLLDNAIKYCEADDSIMVTLRRNTKGVICSVADTGPGIPHEHLPYITRHFYRAAPQKIEGSGLGLAIVSEILRQHDSRLEINSIVNGKNSGTRFCFTLPAVSTQEKQL